MVISRTWRAAVAATVAMAPAASAVAQGDAMPLSGAAMYGIGRTSGHLVRYDVSGAALQSVGQITINGQVATGIEASAYISGDPVTGSEGFQNIFAFWLDPEDHESKLLYVNVETAQAAVVHELEGGRITGAVAVPAGDAQWNVYGVQMAEVLPPFEVTGLVNINPNNNADNEFQLTTAAGVRITRDDLHSDAPLDSNGNFYVGQATLLRVKPKGNGNQNGLVIDGEPFPMQNSNTYILSGEMTVRLYNDKVKSGKAMGHWWIEITGGTAVFVDDMHVATPDRLVHIDHRSGAVTELMLLSRKYDGLASTDGATFLATAGDKLYELNPAAGTETLTGSMTVHDVQGLEFYQGALAGFEGVNDQLVLIETSDQLSTGAADLGTIVFVPLAQDPSSLANGFD